LQSRLVSADLVAMDTAFNRAIAHQLAAFFALRNPDLTPEQCSLLATVSVEAASTLEILSLTGDRQFQHQVLNETKQLLVRYLRPYFPEASHGV